MPAFGGQLSADADPSSGRVHPHALAPPERRSTMAGLIDRDRRGRDRRDRRVEVVPLDRRGRGRARRRSGSRSASSARTTRSRSAARPATRPTLLMPGLRFKLWPMFGVKKFPWVQVPAGEIGVVIAQVGAAAADRRQERGVQARVRQLLRPRTTSSSDGGQKGVQRPVLPAGHARADPPGRVPRAHAADGVRPAGVARARRASPKGGTLTPESFGLVARAAAGRRHRARRRRRPRRRRHRARGRAAAVGRHRQPARRLRRRRRDRGVERGRQHRHHRRRAHRPAARQQERRCTTTTRTSRRSSTPAARSACSTTRCSTARTC